MKNLVNDVSKENYKENVKAYHANDVGDGISNGKREKSIIPMVFVMEIVVRGHHSDDICDGNPNGSL